VSFGKRRAASHPFSLSLLQCEGFDLSTIELSGLHVTTLPSSAFLLYLASSLIGDIFH
jgi:hypothetical protein